MILNVMVIEGIIGSDITLSVSTSDITATCESMTLCMCHTNERSMCEESVT